MIIAAEQRKGPEFKSRCRHFIMTRLAAGGIILSGNDILLVHRKNTSLFSNTWSNPCGLVKPKESYEQACIRELHEGLGVRVSITHRLSDYTHYINGEISGIYAGFLVEIVSGEPQNMIPDLFLDVRYWSIKNLPQTIAPYTLRYLRELDVSRK